MTLLEESQRLRQHWTICIGRTFAHTEDINHLLTGSSDLVTFLRHQCKYVLSGESDDFPAIKGYFTAVSGGWSVREL